MTWIALLRGINVGGSHKLPMAELRALATDLGWSDPRTYIQSGNLVFRASDHPRDALATALSAAIERRYGMQIPVVMRTLEELHVARAENPFPDADANPTKVHVVFLSGPTTATLDPLRSPDDRYQVIGDRIYVKYMKGAGTTKLTLPWIERQTGRVATARNWRSLAKIIDLALG